MKLFKINLRLTFCKKNKNRDWRNVVFTDEPSFYLQSPGVNRWIPKGENNFDAKEKYS